MSVQVAVPRCHGLLSKTVSLLLQRNSISPAEREKYRPRSPPESEHKKLKKEEKDCHVSNDGLSDSGLLGCGQRLYTQYAKWLSDRLAP
jgi:hypothetical protein